MTATGQGFIGNNTFAYCLNNSIIYIDNTATRCVSILSRLDESGKLTVYNSADEAAQAFVEEVYSSSLYIRHEYGTEIYSRTINGATVYDYSTPRKGTPHSVLVGYPTPPGTEMVAFAHTHPNSNVFSGGDVAVANKLGVDAYVVGPNLKLQRYDVSAKKSIDLGIISPQKLTGTQCNSLTQESRVSWDYHTLVGCDFGCGAKDWPTAKRWYE